MSDKFESETVLCEYAINESELSMRTRAWHMSQLRATVSALRGMSAARYVYVTKLEVTCVYGHTLLGNSNLCRIDIS